MSQMMKSKTLSVLIAAAPTAVYEFASNPENLPKWARGFAKSVTPSKGGWVVGTKEGSVALRFVESNALGVLDHIVTLPQGLEIHNSMRVIPNGSGSEVLFTLFQTVNLSEKQFADDAKLVKNDLCTLKRLLEGEQVNKNENAKLDWSCANNAFVSQPNLIRFNIVIDARSMTMKNWIRHNRGLLAFFLFFGLFRTAVADWNPIPTGSMRPNLLEGDVVFVNRLAFDLKLPLTDQIILHLGEPRRGDIVTFSSPKDGTRLIKRVIAVPGDTIAMRNKRVTINGQQASYAELDSVLESSTASSVLQALRLNETTAQAQHRIQWLSGVLARDNFGPLVVPEDHFLMLGDNRDDSGDSRYFGLVERHLLIGRAVRILVSADIKGNWLPRFDRFGQRLD